MFTPLTEEEQATGSEVKDAAPEPDSWQPIQPVPQGAPKAKPHPRLGKPSTLWRFEPCRDCRRLFGLSHATMASSLIWA
jgi:hypothetical protein